MVQYRYNSLEDYLISHTLTVDAQLDDGWGAKFPVKGREIEATILYSDISYFSARTLELSSTEILIFVNNFFAWIAAEALRGSHGIIDKYIGDEIMVVFSKEFGSEDPFKEAVQAARWMSENDALSFCPHIGIASGKVTVGYVGTPLKYSCSVFGIPLTFANRCTSVKPRTKLPVSSSIVFLAKEWEGRDFNEVIPPRKIKDRDGKVQEMPQVWHLLEPRTVALKNIGNFEIQELVNTSMHLPTQSMEERARDALEMLHQEGLYRIQ
jgi:class 3 adenylate cyclase